MALKLLIAARLPSADFFRCDRDRSSTLSKLVLPIRWIRAS